MKGKKYGDDIKEKAYMMYAVCGNASEVSRRLNVPLSTIHKWLKRKTPDELDSLREEKKRDFVEKSSEIIDKSLMLLERRIDRAIEYEAELDEIIDELKNSDNNEISPQTKTELIKTLNKLKVQDIKSLTVAIGTLYDKRALARGESTENSTITVSLPKEIEAYGD